MDKIKALVERWRNEAMSYPPGNAGRYAFDACADEIEALADSAGVEVDAEMVKRADDAYQKEAASRFTATTGECMTAALQAALRPGG